MLISFGVKSWLILASAETTLDQVSINYFVLLRTKYQYSIEKPQNKYSTP
jgi:hypothetical protein